MYEKEKQHQVEEWFEQLTEHMQIFREILRQEFTRIRAHFRITEAQACVLHEIQRRNSCKVTELAECMEVKPSAVTSFISRLEKSGWVKRVHSQQDRRVVLISLTEQGKKWMEELDGMMKAIIKKYLSQLNPAELAFLFEISKKVVQIAKQVPKSSGYRK